MMMTKNGMSLRWAVVAVVAMMFCLVSFAPEVKATACFQALNCVDCLQLPNCSYCGVNNRCMLTTSANNQTCPKIASLQSNDTGGCSECYKSTDCSTCLDDDACGWCGLSQTCHMGDNSGPIDSSSCSKAWQYQSCSDCQSYDQCSDCFSDDACSWLNCGGTYTCQDFNPNFNSSCLIAQRCPCNTHTDCVSCQSDSVCAWCGDNSTCVEISANAPCRVTLFGHCPQKGFSAGSFVGGMFLGAGLLAIAAFVALYLYRRRKAHSYESLAS
eukprot:TRINITY_DN18_c0_g2_i1.p1 TRINITY_DN18_c0_g2~~TRINITY_DN18_c0_g2_i1.p1  ORF type:complete len:270 (-),score=36.19 TRINITY_DN18_c0_g2_i1:83-892(-)